MEDPGPLEAELRRREAALGSDHPAVAEAASTLAILYNQASLRTGRLTWHGQRAYIKRACERATGPCGVRQALHSTGMAIAVNMSKLHEPVQPLSTGVCCDVCNDHRL